MRGGVFDPAGRGMSFNQVHELGGLGALFGNMAQRQYLQMIGENMRQPVDPNLNPQQAQAVQMQQREAYMRSLLMMMNPMWGLYGQMNQNAPLPGTMPQGYGVP